MVSKDLTSIHLICHYVRCCAHRPTATFAMDASAIEQLRYASASTVQDMTRRLIEGRNLGLSPNILLRIWGDCCRMLQGHSLNRVALYIRQNFSEAVQRFVFQCYERNYPAGLASWRTCHETLYQKLSSGQDEPRTGRIRVRSSERNGGAYSRRDSYTNDIVSQVSWSSNDRNGRCVRMFVPYPDMRFHTNDVVFHARD